MVFELTLFSEQEMQALGERFSQGLIPPFFLALEGGLGAGKTTLVRAILRGLGYTGSVKSPTYSLMEFYELPGIQLFHLDLYRIGDPQELEFLGIEEMFQMNALWLIEWPAMGEGFLPKPDAICQIRLGEGSQRYLRVEGLTERGRAFLERI